MVGITLPRPGDSRLLRGGLRTGCGKSSGIADGRVILLREHDSGQKCGLSGVGNDDKRRISALLAEAADWNKLCGLTERGFELVNGKK